MDLRDTPQIHSAEVMALNFIRSNGPYHFRRHFRQGLRSHIIQVLDPADLAAETKGVMIDGIRRFPPAKPLIMLRLFRTRFQSSAQAMAEIRNVKLIERFLPRECYAKSTEFIVSYRVEGQTDLLLGGLQEYVEGDILNPWTAFMSLAGPGANAHSGDGQIMNPGLEKFVSGVKTLIREAGIIPDLAGIGNLVLTRGGELRLVDINNVSQVVNDRILLDDKGYPVCDKSIQVLAKLEQAVRGNLPSETALYGPFLRPDRMRAVDRLDYGFHRQANELM